MSISQSKYVEITSGAGGQAAAGRKDLILRIFTKSAKMPFASVLEFASAADVLNYFGDGSQETKIADVYFGYLSKYQTKPAKISFFKDAREGVEPFLYGRQKAAALTDFQAITAGSFVITLGGITQTITDLDFSEAVSYSDVADAIEVKIREAAASTPLWNDAEVKFEAVDGVFEIRGGAKTADFILPLKSVSEQDTLTKLLGLDVSQNPIASKGSEVLSVNALLTVSNQTSNNYASFSFAEQLTQQTEIVEASVFADASNIAVYLTQLVKPENYISVAEAVKSYKGVNLVYSDIENDLIWVLDAAISASTDFGRPNGAISHDFIQGSGFMPTVFDDMLYSDLISKKINFYGQTSQAGQAISFYQHGYFQGDIDDAGVYVNEIWLKDALTTQFLNYLLAMPVWPANNSGIAGGNAQAQSVLDEALLNGVFSVGKELDATQKAYITTITGDNEAWRKTAENGYYFKGSIAIKTIDGQETKVYKYLLVYSKNDIIRKVEGTHTLI
jgi:hypothetical protein